MSYEDLKQLKPRSAFTDEMNEDIRLISINYDNAIPFGSISYKAQKYPGDLDIIEVFKVCCTREKAIKRMAEELRRINKDIMSKRRHTQRVYFGELKAGLDTRYMFNIGRYVEDYRTKQSHLVDYDRDLINVRLNLLLEADLLDLKDYNAMMKVVKVRPTKEEHEKLHKLLRAHFILRWSDEEISRGFKKLPGGLKMTLEEALQYKTYIKLDIWTLIGGRFMEVTNFYNLVATDKDGNEKSINLGEDLDIPKSLKQEVAKYAFSILDFKPFKMAKRMWALARLINDKKTFLQLTPLINSDASLINQIVAEMEVIVNILSRTKGIPKAHIISQLNQFKFRLATVTQIQLDNEGINSMLDEEIGKAFNKRRMINLLETIMDDLKNRVKNYALYFLEQRHLFPPPLEYLPE